MITIPLLIPDMPSADDLLPWLRMIDANKWYTNYGPVNTEFEQQLLKQFDDQNNLHLTTVANCTLGLELALSELGLEPGSQVLIPTLTFVATGTAILRTGLTPVLGEIDEKTWLLTPEIALDALRHAPIKAVMPVSTFGRVQDVAAWDAFTSKTGIPVVVDAAGALGNQQIGKYTTAVFSLHATKSLGAGEGGFIVARSEDLIRKIRLGANFGIDVASPIGNVVRPGTNAKLSEYHAAVGLAALPQWQRHKAVRSSLYTQYRNELEQSVPNVRFQAGSENQIHTILPVRLRACRGIATIMQKMAENGVGVRRWYSPPLHLHSGFQHCPVVGELHIAETIGRELLGLPFYPSLSNDKLRRVVTELAHALKMLEA